jgi:hypothetical protein
MNIWSNCVIEIERGVIAPSANSSKSKTNNTTGKPGLNLVKFLSLREIGVIPKKL